MSVIQHASAQTTSQQLSVTLTSPVTAGNLIVAVVAYSKFNSISDFTHDANPSTSFGLLTSVSGSASAKLDAYMQLALLSESYTLEIDFANNDGIGKHIHLFEVSGYDSFDKQNTNIQTTTTPSVGVTVDTSAAAEFVLAAFLDQTHTGETFTAGAGYTAGETTNTNSFSLFTEYNEISSVGQPSASATIPNNDTVCSLIVTFYASGNSGGGGNGSGGGTSTTFLGSVRVVGSTPAGESNPFLGTVKVVASAPSGVPNPYLGQVVVGSPSGSQTNPTLGQVVVVSVAPTDDDDPFLGTVSES